MTTRFHALQRAAARRLMRLCLIVAGAALASAATTARAQSLYPPAATQPRDLHVEIPTEDVQRSGPRYGAIWLSPGIADSIKAHNKGQTVNATTSLFGWEFQSQLLDNPGGITPVTNLVLGVAGLDQGLLLPSASWLVGMRSKDDFEFGIGPNISLLGPALAIAAGMTFHSGKLNIPFDVAYVSSRIGPRFSFTTGFNVMK